MNKELLKEFKVNGFDVRAFETLDGDGDTSTLGEYTDDLVDGNIVRKFGKYFEDLTEEERDDLPERRGREFRAFKPYAGGEKTGTEDYKTYGMQDYKRMEGLDAGDWCYMGVIVKASRNGIDLGEASLWGIESDSGAAYLDEVIKDLSGEAVAEAKKNLKELCQTKEA